MPKKEKDNLEELKKDNLENRKKLIGNKIENSQEESDNFYKENFEDIVLLYNKIKNKNDLTFGENSPEEEFLEKCKKFKKFIIEYKNEGQDEIEYRQLFPQKIEWEEESENDKNKRLVFSYSSPTKLFLPEEYNEKIENFKLFEKLFKINEKEEIFTIKELLEIARRLELIRFDDIRHNELKGERKISSGPILKKRLEENNKGEKLTEEELNLIIEKSNHLYGGLLKIVSNEKTIILSGLDNHFIVYIQDPLSSDNVLITGYLTSEKDEDNNIKLSDNQPLNNNKKEKDNKEQWFRPLKSIIRIKKEKLQEESSKSEEVTNFLNDKEIKIKIQISIIRIENIKNEIEEITIERLKEKLLLEITFQKSKLEEELNELLNSTPNLQELEVKRKNHIFYENLNKFGKGLVKEIFNLLEELQNEKREREIRIKKIRKKKEFEDFKKRLQKEKKELNIKKDNNENNNE